MTRLHFSKQRARAAAQVLAGSCALFCAQVSAQEPELLMPETPTLAAAEEVQAERLGETLLESAAVTPEGLDAAIPVVTPQGAEDDTPRRVAGRWRVAPHLDLRTTWDDNIFIQPDDEVSDVIFSVAPGISAGIWSEPEEADRFLDRERAGVFLERARGSFFFADYTAILLGFAKTDSENAFNQDARIEGQWQTEKLTLGARARGESRSETNIDIGDRVQRDTIDAAATARYELSEKTALEAGVFYTLHDYEDRQRSTEWRGETFLEYAVSPLLRASFGLAVGQVEVEDGATQTFERLLARGVYSVSEKLGVAVRGGVEFRQSNGEVGDRTSPIFEVELDYAPAAASRVALAAYRRVETSALRPDQDFTVTGVALRLRREVRAGLHLTLEGGFRHADYTSVRGEPERTDRYFFVRPGLLYHFARWGSAELSYEHRENRSSRGETSFENNQISLQVSLAY